MRLNTQATLEKRGASWMPTSHTHLYLFLSVPVGSTGNYFTAVCPASSTGAMDVFGDSSCQSAVATMSIQATPISDAMSMCSSLPGSISSQGAYQAFCSSSAGFSASPSPLVAAMVIGAWLLRTLSLAHGA